MPKFKKLTKKQKKFVEEYALTGNGTESVINAGYDVNGKNSAKTIASENLTKPYLARAIEQKKEDLGIEISNELLVEKHLQLLNKKEVIVIRKGQRTETELTEQPHSDVKGALDMAYKLKGSYAPEKKITVDIGLKELLDANNP